MLIKVKKNDPSKYLKVYISPPPPPLKKKLSSFRPHTWVNWTCTIAINHSIILQQVPVFKTSFSSTKILAELTKDWNTWPPELRKFLYTQALNLHIISPTPASQDQVKYLFPVIWLAIGLSFLFRYYTKVEIHTAVWTPAILLKSAIYLTFQDK